MLGTRADWGTYMNSHSAWGPEVLLSAFLQRLFPKGRASPHLCPDQGLKAGLEVVKSAAIEPWHLVQELFVLGLKVFPYRPQLFSGLGNKIPVWGGCGNS